MNVRSTYTRCSILLAALTVATYAQTPPGQPAVGPGGRDYSSSSLRVTGPLFVAGHPNDNAFRYWIFEPAGPAPATAPVVLFLHGFAALAPSAYQFWTAHMVLKGYTVVWAQYQAEGSFDTWNWANNAASTLIDALAVLDTPGHVRPARDVFNRYATAIVGHSAGGFMGAVLAAKATRSWWAQLPKPKVVVSIEGGAKRLIPGEDYSRIDPNTRMLFVSGEDDSVVCLDQTIQIWNDSVQIPPVNRDFLLVRSDRHSSPQLIANHFFPNTNGIEDTAAVDARDYFVTFKLSVAALNCAFKGTDCPIAFGKGSSAQVDMGIWSDNVPVKPMQWAASPQLVTPPCLSQVPSIAR